MFTFRLYIFFRETVRTRSKEGEVDYRYMPEPDLPPLVISEDMVLRI
jgi:aspartyl-tRNA(Asn)/glutamyl-tRNA(Gln) amidotransferase subunit B